MSAPAAPRRGTGTGSGTGPLAVASGITAGVQSKTETAPAAVRLSGVVKDYGSVRALDGLDLVVPRGGVFGLLGPNGAGKSTLMRLLTGGAVATSGAVEVLGLPLPAASLAVRARTGFVPQADNLDSELTCAENLAVYARLYGLPAVSRADAVSRGLTFARLQDRADTLTGKLSGGMRRRLLIARGLLHHPELVLLDEPTVGLDPQVRHELWNQVDAIGTGDATIVLTTHYIEEAERLCDEVAIIDRGRLLACDRPAALIAEHVRSDIVVEVIGDDARRRRVQAAAHAAGIASRSAGTSIAVFTTDVDAALGDQPVLEPGDLVHRLQRPANLEDVFVSLTGELLA